MTLTFIYIPGECDLLGALQDVDDLDVQGEIGLYSVGVGDLVGDMLDVDDLDVHGDSGPYSVGDLDLELHDDLNSFARLAAVAGAAVCSRRSV